VVLVAGSTMHFLIAMVLVPIALFGFGDQRSTLRVGEIPPCVPIVELAKCGPNDAAAPAQGVLQVGDEIVAVGGKQVSQWLDVTRAIRAAGAGPLAITVRRDGQQLDLRPTLIEVERTDLDAPDATGKKTKVGALGISPATERVRPSVGTGLKDSGTQLWEDVKGTFLSLGKFPAAVPKAFSAAFSNKERDPNGFVGPVGIARISGQVAERSGVGRFLLLIAAFNIFIGIVNLLPLLPLDGGHVAVLLFEKARSAIARALGRKDPGRVDLRKLMPVATLVVALLATLTVLMLFADVNNPINLPG
jgi:RIP metalloprotease RseP